MRIGKPAESGSDADAATVILSYGSNYIRASS